jgi:hypothetical protein
VETTKELRSEKFETGSRHIVVGIVEQRDGDWRVRVGDDLEGGNFTAFSGFDQVEARMKARFIADQIRRVVALESERATIKERRRIARKLTGRKS